MSVLRAVLNFFYEIFLGCSHSHLTRIFTVKQETYRVCLDCGKHILHSPISMRALTARELRRMKTAHAGELKIMPASISSGGTLRPAKRKSNVA